MKEFYYRILEISMNFLTFFFHFSTRYKIVGRHRNVLDKQQKYFIEVVNSNTKNVVYAHVLFREEYAMKAESLKK